MEMWGDSKGSNIHVIRVLEEEEKGMVKKQSNK